MYCRPCSDDLFTQTCQPSFRGVAGHGMPKRSKFRRAWRSQHYHFWFFWTVSTFLSFVSFQFGFRLGSDGQGDVVRDWTV